MIYSQASLSVSIYPKYKQLNSLGGNTLFHGMAKPSDEVLTIPDPNITFLYSED